MISAVDKASLQVTSNTNSAGTTQTKSSTFNILNEAGRYGYENDAFTDDAVKAYNLAQAILGVSTRSFVGAKVSGTEEIGGNE